MGLGYKCLRREYIMQGVEQSLTAPAGRLHRSLPVALGRRVDAVRGDARSLFAAHPAGKGQDDRRVQSHGRAAVRASAGGERQGTRCRATRRCSRSTTFTTARASKGRCRSFALARASGRHHLLFARRRLSHRQVSQREGLRQEPARARDAEVHESAWDADSARTRRGRAAPSRQAGARRARLGRWADRA